MQVKDKQIEFFKALRAKLPPQYAREISKRLVGISIVQVRSVFYGDITNLELIKLVTEKAEEIIKETTQAFKIEEPELSGVGECLTGTK